MRKYTKFFFPILSIILISTSTIYADQKTDSDIQKKICPNGDCRKDVLVTIKQTDGTIFQKKYDIMPPVVQGDMITILPSEVINIEVVFENERAVSLKSVGKIVRPEKTMVFKFNQEPEMGDGTHMMLVASNPFSQILKYHATMMTMDGQTTKTSSCPIRSGTENYEMWPHPIFQLIIEGIHFVEEGSKDGTVCKY